MLFRSQGLISVDVVHYLSIGNHFRAAVYIIVVVTMVTDRNKIG